MYCIAVYCEVGGGTISYILELTYSISNIMKLIYIMEAYYKVCAAVCILYLLLIYRIYKRFQMQYCLLVIITESLFSVKKCIFKFEEFYILCVMYKFCKSYTGLYKKFISITCVWMCLFGKKGVFICKLIVDSLM